MTTQPPPAVAQALTTPLMVGLAKTIYNPRPGEHTGALPNPAELLDLGCFPDRTTVEQHLFDGFIPAAYRPHPDPKRTSRWSAPQAESWLVFLAHHLEDRLHTTDLRWWEISRAIPEWFLKLTTGLTAGLGYGLTTRLAVELAGGLGFGLVFGLASGVIYGFLSESTADPAQGVRWSPDAGVKAGLKAGLGYGLAAGLRVGLTVGLMTMTGWGVIGGRGAWPSFTIARWWLAVRGRLPWALMAFLADAHQQRGVLRQVGAFYQFRHAELQRRLATRP